MYFRFLEGARGEVPQKNAECSPVRQDGKKMKKFATRLVAANLTLLGLAGCALEDAKLTPVFKTATAERSANWQAIYQIGKARLSAGYYGLALQKFRIAFAKNPKSIAVMNALAATYDRLGRAELAEVYYAKALAIEPDSVQTLNNYGYSKLMREQFTEAVQLFDRAMTHKPSTDMVSLIAANRKLAISKRQVAMQQIEKFIPAMSVMAEKIHQRNCLRSRTVQIETNSRRVHTLITRVPGTRNNKNGEHATDNGNNCDQIAAKREHILISDAKTPRLFSAPEEPAVQPDPPKAAPRIAVTRKPLPMPAAARERNTELPQSRPQKQVPVAEAKPERSIQPTMDVSPQEQPVAGISSPSVSKKPDAIPKQVTESTVEPDRLPLQAPTGRDSSSSEAMETVTSAISFDDTTVPAIGVASEEIAAAQVSVVKHTERVTPKASTDLAANTAASLRTSGSIVRLAAKSSAAALSAADISKKFDRVVASFTPKSSVEPKAEGTLGQPDFDGLFETIVQKDSTDTQYGVRDTASVGSNFADRAEMEELNDVGASQDTLLAMAGSGQMTDVPSRKLNSEPWETQSVNGYIARREVPKPVFDGPERVMFASARTGTILDNSPLRYESASKTEARADLPAAFDVEVSNGAGRLRLAARVSAYLRSQDMPVSYLTNARRFDHMMTIIFYKPGMRGRAEAFAAKLPIAADLRENSDQYSDVRILLGGDILDFDREKLFLADIGAPNA